MSSVVKRIVSAGLTHTGRVRKHNEDSFSRDDEEKLWVVADGMGGYAAGEVASELTVKTVNDQVGNSVALPEAFVKAHETVTRAVKENLTNEGMATTVIALQVLDDAYHLSWVGDSRAYLLRGDELILVSRDHSYFEWLLDQGLSRAEALSDPRHEQLTQGIGLDTPDPGSIKNDIQSGDRWLLCSDGLYKELPTEKIHAALAQKSEAPAVCGDLVQQALKNGGRDNVSVVVIDFDPEKRLNRYGFSALASWMSRFGALLRRHTWLSPLLGAMAAIIIFAVFLLLR